MKYVLFWLKSSRGTDTLTIKKVDDKIAKSDIKILLEDWCAKFGAWHVSDNMCSYGYRFVKIPPKRDLQKKWKKLCDSRTRINKQWEITRQMLMVK